MDFGGGALTKHGKDELEIIHVIAKIVMLKSLDFLILGRGHAKSSFADLGSEYLVLPIFFGSPLLPLFCEIFANSDASHSFFDPAIRISLSLIEGTSSFGSEFWILDLLDSFVADFG